MPERFAGKIHYTDEEAKQLGLIPSAEEIARNQQILDQFNTTLRNAPPSPDGRISGFGGRHSDDHLGTEFESWTRDDTGQWYDKHGQPVHWDAGASQWTDAQHRPIAYDKAADEWRPL